MEAGNDGSERPAGVAGASNGGGPQMCQWVGNDGKPEEMKRAGNDGMPA